MEHLTISKLEQRLIFKTIIHFVNMKTDPRLHVEVLAPRRSDGVLTCCKTNQKREKTD
jgi:hypothetical protein